MFVETLSFNKGLQYPTIHSIVYLIRRSVVVATEVDRDIKWIYFIGFVSVIFEQPNSRIQIQTRDLSLSSQEMCVCVCVFHNKNVSTVQTQTVVTVTK